MCVLSVLDFLIAFIREWLSDFGQARPGSDVNLNQYQCVCVCGGWWLKLSLPVGTFALVLPINGRRVVKCCMRERINWHLMSASHMGARCVCVYTQSDSITGQIRF